MTQPLLARPYRHPFDMERMAQLIKSRPVDRILNYPALADIEELLVLPAIQATTRIWENADGMFAGYALFNHGPDFANLYFEIDSRLAGRQVEEEMLAWGEHVYCVEYHGEAGELATGVTLAQPERIALLEQHGYQRDPECALFFVRPLDQAIPTPCLPDGFDIRPLKGEKEVPAWVDMHRAAFGTENMTIEYRLAMMAAPSYSAELDLVATAPDGSLAAYVVGTIHNEENALTGQKIGWTDPVATHPRWQRMGLSRALLHASLLLLKLRGMEFARLGTSSENIAMQRTAQAAGYQLAGQTYHYMKKLRG